MLYEYNRKIYIKPFSNKMVEVEISKSENEYDVKPTKKFVEITPEIREKIVEISLENAYTKTRKIERKITDTI